MKRGRRRIRYTEHASARVPQLMETSMGEYQSPSASSTHNSGPNVPVVPSANVARQASNQTPTHFGASRASSSSGSDAAALPPAEAPLAPTAAAVAATAPAHALTPAPPVP